MNSKIALNNLIELTSILKNNNVVHWITDGTLLGFYRENNFISHDTDTDIGVLFKSFDVNVVTDCLNSGYKVHHILGYPKDSLEITFVKDGVRTDLFFFYEDGDKFHHSAFNKFSNLTYNRIDYYYDKFEVKEDIYLNNSFFIPEDPLKFILTKYGPNWETPIKRWDYANSPLNSVQTNTIINRSDSIKSINEWMTRK
jgi:hypothetical protein